MLIKRLPITIDDVTTIFVPESELISLRGELEALEKHYEIQRQSRKQACLEVEQLRAEIAIAWDDTEETQRANDAERQLAAANAEVEELRMLHELAEDKCGRLRTEVERLRAENSKLYGSKTRVREAELASLLAVANSLLRRWSNFDFDCSDEFDDEIQDEQEDGWALEKLYTDTAAYLGSEK